MHKINGEVEGAKPCRELLKALAETKHIVVNFVILELLTFSFTQVNQLQHSFTCYISSATPTRY